MDKLLSAMTPDEIKQEYAQCRVVEKKFYPKLRKLYMFPIECQLIASITNRLCTSLGYRPPRFIRINVGGMGKNTAAQYTAAFREIQLPGKSLHITSVIHELAHHIMHEDNNRGKTHGQEFCDREEILFETFLELYTPKPWYEDDARNHSESNSVQQV